MNNFIPYGKQNIDEQDIQAVVNVLRSPYITQGPLIESFEAAVSQKTQSQYSVAVNSATSALHLACLALGLSEGDYLWTSPITFVASANCALYCNASVDFVDIDPSTGLLSISQLKNKLAKAKVLNKLPKILIPVHLAGTSCDMEEIYKLSSEYNFSVIEDASHALGGSYNASPIGSCKYSDITVFSFHPVKIITSGEGGLITTNNPDLAAKLSALRSHGIIKDPRFFTNKNPSPWTYEQQFLGFNYRMSDIHAALGLSQLSRLNHFVNQRNKIWANYSKLLASLPITLLTIPSNCYSALHLAVIRLNNKSEDFHKELFVEMRGANIGVQLHYSPVHLQPFYTKLGFKTGDFVEAENYAKNSFSLPIYPGLSLDQQSYIAKKLEQLICHLS